MLDNMKEGDVIEEEGTMEELKNACESALPKIKNMLKDEQDDEKIDELNEIKSIIKGVVLKYQDIKHGRYDTEYDISGKFKSETNSLSDKNMPPQPISLIDLDDTFNGSSTSSSPAVNATAAATSKNALDELVDIFGEKASVSSTTNTSAPSMDPFDLLSQSMQSNTLPPSIPNLNTISSSSSSSSTTTTTITTSSSPTLPSLPSSSSSISSNSSESDYDSNLLQEQQVARSLLSLASTNTTAGTRLPPISLVNH